MTVRDFFDIALCYADSNGRVRPEAAVRLYGLERVLNFEHRDNSAARVR